MSIMFYEIWINEEMLPKYIHIYIYIYMYIYILTNLLSTSKEKEKKSPEFRDNNISNNCLGKKEKDYRETKKKKKRKGQLRHTSWKKSRDMQSVGQKNKNPPQNAAMLQWEKVINTK